MAKDRHTGAFIFGAVIGALAGAAVTLWLTPRSGSEMREEIFGRGRDLQQRLQSTTEQVQGKTQDLLDQGRQKLGGEGDTTVSSAASGVAAEPGSSATAEPAPTVPVSTEEAVATAEATAPPPEAAELAPRTVSPSEETATLAEVADEPPLPADTPEEAVQKAEQSSASRTSSG